MKKEVTLLKTDKYEYGTSFTKKRPLKHIDFKERKPEELVTSFTNREGGSGLTFLCVLLAIWRVFEATRRSFWCHKTSARKKMKASEHTSKLATTNYMFLGNNF